MIKYASGTRSMFPSSLFKPRWVLVELSVWQVKVDFEVERLLPVSFR